MARVADDRPLVTLELNDVHAAIGSSRILHGVTFEVITNGVTAILGRNGVGKTTTLRSVLGLTHSTGRITFNGHRIDGLPTHKIVQMGIAYVPEDRDVFHGLTVSENLRLAENGDGKPRYDLVYELFPEMADRRQQKAGTLSGGQQQMLSLSRGLLNENALLLIDEPTKGLAPRIVSEVVSVLERMRRTTTILMVEQNLNVARRLSDHAVVMTEGTVVLQGPAAQVLNDEDSMRRVLGVSTRSTNEE